MVAEYRAEGRRWRSIVHHVIRRDGGICHLCGQPGADSADHLVPPKRGGSRYALSNLRAVHHNVQPRCNRIRGDRPIDVAKAEIAALLGGADDWEW